MRTQPPRDTESIHTRLYTLMRARKDFLRNIKLRNVYYREYNRQKQALVQNKEALEDARDKFDEYKQLVDAGRKAEYSKEIFMLRTMYLQSIGETLDTRCAHIINKCRERCKTAIEYFTSSRKTQEIVTDYMRNKNHIKFNEIRYEIFANYNILEELYSTVFLANSADTKLILGLLNIDEQYDSMHIMINKIVMIRGAQLVTYHIGSIIEKIGQLSKIVEHYNICSKIDECKIEYNCDHTYLVFS